MFDPPVGEGWREQKRTTETVNRKLCPPQLATSCKRDVSLHTPADMANAKRGAARHVCDAWGIVCEKAEQGLARNKSKNDVAPLSPL